MLKDMARTKRTKRTKDVNPRSEAWKAGLRGEELVSAAHSFSSPVTEGNGGLSVSVGPRRMSVDAIINLLAGAGGPLDKLRATQWAFATSENWQSLTNLYRASWLAKKIVTARNKDMLRPKLLLDWDGHDKKNKDSDRVKKAITRWRLPSLLMEALFYKSLYGGSIIVLGIGSSNPDLQDLTKPLPMKDGAIDYSFVKKNSLRYLRVFDRWRAQHDGVLDNQDPTSPNCGMPMNHILSDPSSAFMGQSVHWSRVIRFDGAWVPWITWRSNAMWMDSELQVVIDVLKTYDSTTSAIANLIFEANVDVLSSSELVKNLASAGGEEAVMSRYLQLAKQKGNYRLAVIDKELETYQRHPFNFSGLDKIWEKIMLDVAGATEYPVTRLFGQAPAGLNATGDSDERNYYAGVAAIMESDLRPRLSPLLEVIIRNELGYLPDGFEFEWEPLWQPTPTEQSQIRLNRANRDKLYIDMSVVTPGLVARELKEDGEYRTMEDADVKLAEELDQPPDMTGLETDLPRKAPKAANPLENPEAKDPVEGEPEEAEEKAS